MPVPRRDPWDRFQTFITRDDNGCWLWNGHLGWQGYGNFWDGDKNVRAHRWAYEKFVGPIGDGLTLDHLCRVCRCANPEHLEPLTIRDNLMRGQTPAALNAAKTECPDGHPYTAESTYPDPRGKRGCRICRRAASAASRQRRLALRKV